ncbi:uncharacterized protein BDR25DRAFT_340533 [Lindgomyces ingoldianus]|uniref:Uncharacterized protein n=1 Tax=Lindgomyces ingoldianus TaxID=673940 RepID=A0ACB6R6A8_9PLEO|nr:uncharacterized protein BDR25DRAFT_340533 [Lindgomyces ingoldianus]KAF2474828.1 hypothetical protein BDR25DRAFT_340533 [Lindgomyces ingoldianus]
MACNASILSILASLCVLSFILQIPFLTLATCYYPNGDTDDGHKSCNSGGVSVCCSEGNQCLSNGLCVDTRYENFQRVLRGGCTDSGWGTPCPSFCKAEWNHGDEAVYYCGSGKWCCESHDCCTKSGAQMLDLGTPQVVATADKDTNNNNAQPTSAALVNVQQSSAPPANTQPPQQQTSQQQQQQAPASSPPSEKKDTPKASSTPPPSSPSSKSNDAARTSPSTSSPTSHDPKATASKAPANEPATIVFISGYSIISPGTSSTTSFAPPESTIPPPKHPINPAVIGAGVGVGGGVVVFLILFFTCFYLQRRKRQKEGFSRGTTRRSIATGDSEAPLDVAGIHGRSRNRYGRGSGVLIELDAERVIELPSETEAKELEGKGKGEKDLRFLKTW